MPCLPGPALPWPLVIILTTAINSDPICCKTMDPDMTLCYNWGRIPPWSWMAVQVTQIGMAPVTVWLPTWPQMVDQAQASTQPSLVTWAMDIIPALRYGMATDPNMALSCSSGTDISMACGGSTGHSDQYGPGSIMTLRHQHGLRWHPKPPASSVNSMAFSVNSSLETTNVLFNQNFSTILNTLC